MKKIKLKDVLFIIFTIVFIICTMINNVYRIPVIFELCIDRFGLNIGSIITVVDAYICILLTAICIISAIKVIQCIFFHK